MNRQHVLHHCCNLQYFISALCQIRLNNILRCKLNYCRCSNLKTEELIKLFDGASGKTKDIMVIMVRKVDDWCRATCFESLSCCISDSSVSSLLAPNSHYLSETTLCVCFFCLRCAACSRHLICLPTGSNLFVFAAHMLISSSTTGGSFYMHLFI